MIWTNNKARSVAGTVNFYRRTLLRGFWGVCLGGLLFGKSSEALVADRKIRIIRDAETETLLYGVVRDLFALSGLSPETVRIFIVEDNAFNAFVNVKGHMFVYTGLINELDNFSELVAVLAHETAHLALHHPVQTLFDIEGISQQALLGSMLGVIGGLATGKIGVAIGTASLGTTMAEQRVAEEMRTRELSADLMGMELLERMGYDPSAMLGVIAKMKRLERLMVLEGGYFQTHPLSSTREQQAEQVAGDLLSKAAPQVRGSFDKVGLYHSYQSVRIKMLAYTLPLEQALLRFRSPKNTAELYGYAITLLRYGRIEEPLRLLKEVSLAWPDYLYVNELIAATYLHSGTPEQAYKWMKDVVEKSVDSPLLWLSYGEILMRVAGKDNEAERWLWRALERESWLLGGWRNLMTIYSKRGDRGKLLLSHAEFSYYQGRKEQARNLAKQAYEYLQNKEPSMAARAQDILLQL